MNNQRKRSWLYFTLELLIYGVLVSAYLFVVAHFLNEWIQEIYRKDNRLYALLSLLLIVAQGLVLDVITRTVMNSVHPKWK